MTALCNRLSPIKLGSRTQSGHGLALGGRHFKNNKTSKKKIIKQAKVKKIYLPLIYIIQSAILNHTLSSSKGKKITKTVNTKDSQVTASLYTKIYKFAIFRLLPQTTAHLSLQSTTCLNQWSLQETIGHGFTKSRRTAPN